MNLIKTIIISLSLFGATAVSAQSYKGVVDLGFIAGAGKLGLNRFETSMINGVQFNDWLYAGVGIGLQVRQPVYDLMISAPIFASIEGVLAKEFLSPFFEIRLGYTVTLTEYNKFYIGKEGVYFNPSIGFKWNLNGKNAMRFSTGYLLQTINVGNNILLPFTQIERKNSLVARVGFEF